MYIADRLYFVCLSVCLWGGLILLLGITGSCKELQKNENRYKEELQAERWKATEKRLKKTVTTEQIKTTEYRYFQGTIGAKYGIIMRFKSDGLLLQGDYYYTHIGKAIDLSGNITADGILHLVEYGEEQDKTANFEGRFEQGELGEIVLKGLFFLMYAEESLYFECHEVMANDYAPELITTAQQQQQIAFQTKHRIFKEQDQQLSINYPQFISYVNYKHQMFCNKLIEKQVQRALKTWKRLVLTNADSLYTNINFICTYNKNDLISVWFTVDSDSKKIQQIQNWGINYDLKTNKSYCLNDIFYDKIFNYEPFETRHSCSAQLKPLKNKHHFAISIDSFILKTRQLSACSQTTIEVPFVKLVSYLQKNDLTKRLGLIN